MRLAQGGTLGANLGTTLIVQLVSFEVAYIAPALILISALMFRRASAGPRDARGC
jgi:phosphate:Na+ symporter